MVCCRIARDATLRAKLRTNARSVAEGLSWMRVFDEFEDVLFDTIARNTALRPQKNAANSPA